MATISLQHTLWQIDSQSFNINSNDMLVIIYISHRIKPDGTGRVKFSSLSEKLKLSEKTIIKSIVKLKRNGIIEIMNECDTEIECRIIGCPYEETHDSEEKWKRLTAAVRKLCSEYPRKDGNGSEAELSDELERILNPKLPNHHGVKLSDLILYAKQHHSQNGRYSVGLLRFLKEDIWLNHHRKK